MEFKYATNFIFVRSNWFDKGDNKFKDVGDKAFFLYLNLFRFLVNNQEHTYTFYTSIDKIRKVTGYSENLIVELIRLLEKEKVVETNVTKWSRMYDENKKVKSHDFLVIYSISKPNVVYKDGKYVPATDSPDDKYITIDLRLMQLYQDKGFNEKFYPMFCLMNKWNHNSEGKMWVSMNNIAEILGFGDPTVTHVIRELNRNYLLLSEKRDNGKKGKMYEHKIINNIVHVDSFKKDSAKERIEKNIKDWEKPKKPVTAKKKQPKRGVNYTHLESLANLQIPSEEEYDDTDDIFLSPF